MEKALRKQMGKKVKAIELNMSALKAGYDYAEANLPKQDPFVVEPMNKTQGMILIEGNAAAAIGCMMAGVTFVGWYPITPSSSLCESLIDYLKKYRKDPETGKNTYAVIQAEDELAALGMVLGAGWVGARSMTSSAGPGISLMSEFTASATTPRFRPSSSTSSVAARPPVCRRAPVSRTSCRRRCLSHGDTKHPLLLRPPSPSATRWLWRRSTSPNRCRRRCS
jgi:2-oxoglutarate ferredoxin oxidoreductase subunit alpha